MMLVIISLLIGFFLSFLICQLVTAIILSREDIGLIIALLETVIALIISSTIIIIGTIIKRFPNKKE